MAAEQQASCGDWLETGPTTAAAAAPSSSSTSGELRNPKLREALEKCSLRFIDFLPSEILYDPPRLCFEIQEAYWYYNDHLLANDKRDLPPLKQIGFFSLMLRASSTLRGLYAPEKMQKQLTGPWDKYCQCIQWLGAAIVDRDYKKCLMIQPWVGNKWKFPGGKIEKGETHVEGAIREILEETGIDISSTICKDDHAEKGTWDQYPAKLFFVAQGLQDGDCLPKANKEVGKIAWVPLSRLPGWTTDEAGTTKSSKKLQFSEVAGFVPGLQRWVVSRTTTFPPPRDEDVPVPTFEPAARRRDDNTEFDSWWPTGS